MKFKVGDRVKAFATWDENSKIKGVCGTVLRADEKDFSVGIRFEKKIGGHDLGGICPNGYGWNTGVEVLEHAEITNWKEALK